MPCREVCTRPSTANSSLPRCPCLLRKAPVRCVKIGLNEYKDCVYRYDTMALTLVCCATLDVRYCASTSLGLASGLRTARWCIDSRLYKRHRESTRRCVMKPRASVSVCIESSTGFEQLLFLKCAKLCHCHWQRLGGHDRTRVGFGLRCAPPRESRGP